MRRIHLLILLTAFLISCATTDFIQTGETYTPYNGFVKVYFEMPTDIEYDEIGIVSVNSGEFEDESSILIRKMQKEAAKVGANAIIIVSSSETQEYVANQYYAGTSTDKEMLAIAIRVKK